MRAKVQYERGERAGRVLVLGTDDRVILAVARSLGRHGLTVHLGWCAPDSIAARSCFVSKTHCIPPYAANDNRWKDTLRDILQSEKFDLVIPCNDSTLVPLVANREDFAQFDNLYLLPDEVFSVVSDKFNTYQLALREGVQVPRGRVMDGTADADRLIEEFGLPLILKPQASITAHSVKVAHVVRRVRTREDLQCALAELGSSRVLVQENFVGRGVGVEMLVQEGQVLFAFQHARIHETVEWGSTYRESVAVSPELLEAASRLMKAVGYTGVAMAEFIVNPETGRWVFLEINGRFWGSLPLAVNAGAEFPYYLYQMLVEGKRDFSPAYRHKVRCRNVLMDLNWVKSQRQTSGWRKTLLPVWMAAELASVVIHRDYVDSFNLDDPAPQIAELRHVWNKAWHKIIGKSSLPRQLDSSTVISAQSPNQDSCSALAADASSPGTLTNSRFAWPSHFGDSAEESSSQLSAAGDPLKTQHASAANG